MADLVMHKLSPATKAVVLAFTNDPDWMKICEEERASLAAALRAAVAHTQQHHGHDVFSREVWECDADELLAIADELEAQ
jgi:hypothetical protein